jgi:acetyltransferase-like isoleucine patch superfamily enzyme
MALEVRDEGLRNRIEIAPDTDLNGVLVLHGDDNFVRIAPNCSSAPTFWVELGTECSFEIERGCSLHGLVVWAERDAHVSVGANSGFNGTVRLQLHEPGRITVGHGCLFGGDVEISVSDMHSITDAWTGERINPPADVHISDRVWVGQRTMIMKGTRIGKHCVIGAGSVVAGRIPQETVSAGAPARVIRRDVNWNYYLLPWQGSRRRIGRVRSSIRHRLAPARRTKARLGAGVRRAKSWSGSRPATSSDERE